MKTVASIAGIISILFVSCTNNTASDKQAAPVPNALDDKESSADIVSKRYQDNLVETLYQDMLDTTPGLKKLESEIARLKKSEGDSTAAFDQYNSKNKEYFFAANRLLASIEDSVVREKIKAVIVTSSSRYDSSISTHTKLHQLIDTKTTSLHDLHTVLKITRTLPIIEKYQQNKLPAAGAMERYLNHLEKVIQETDSLARP